MMKLQSTSPFIILYYTKQQDTHNIYKEQKVK